MAAASLQTYADVKVKVEPAYSGYVKIYKALVGEEKYEYVATTYSSHTFSVPVVMEVTIILYKVKLEAAAMPGYVFSKWVVDGQESKNPTVEFTVTKDVTATAYFVVAPVTPPVTPTPGAAVTLSVAVNRYGWGNVKVFVDGAYRTTVYRGEFFKVSSGSRIKLAASPSAGYLFDYFLVDSAKYTAPEVEFTITKDTAATAYFKEAPPTVTYVYVEVSVEPYGGGYVNVYVNDYFRAMVTGTYAFKTEKNSKIRCEAYPNPGYFFDRWVVNSQENRNPAIEFIADRDLKAKAYFKSAPTPPKQYTLSIAVSPVGSGSISIYVNNVYKKSTSSSYSLTLNEGDAVKLSATPSSGYEFDRYVYDRTTYTDRTLSFTMAKDISVTAYFREVTPPPPTPPTPSPPTPTPPTPSPPTPTPPTPSPPTPAPPTPPVTPTPIVTPTPTPYPTLPPFEWGKLMQTLFPIIIIFFILALIVSLFR
ncbi:MAG: hypothetical protein QXI60_10745 [Thermofilaceae archaeon]